MARDVEISLLDIIESTYPKSLKQSEPVMLRRSEVIKQIGTISKPSMRLATSGSEINVNSDTELGNALQQYATVNEVQGVHDIATQGFQDITVKYGLGVVMTGNGFRSYYDLTTNPPVEGDLALSTYNEFGMPLEYFIDNGDRCGILGNDTIPGMGGYLNDMPLYRYNGTKWLPCVFDIETNKHQKYRVTVQYDYRYFFNDVIHNIGDEYESDISKIPEYVRNCLQQQYRLEYIPITNAPTGITRICRIHKDRHEGMASLLHRESRASAFITCGWTSA